MRSGSLWLLAFNTTRSAGPNLTPSIEEILL